MVSNIPSLNMANNDLSSLIMTSVDLFCYLTYVQSTF